MDIDVGHRAGRQQRKIVVEIDESPLSLAPPTEADYIGRQITSALFQPLVRWRRDRGEFVPGVADSWTTTDDGLRWDFRISSDAQWSNGSNITAEHALAGIVAAARHPLWSRYLHCLYRGEASADNRLSLTLRYPFPPLLALLSVPDLAPAPPSPGSQDEARVFSGPYLLAHESRETIHLTPNPAVRGAERRPPLTFVRNRCPAGSIPAYLAGQVDVTAHTGFPFDQLPDWRGHHDYRTAMTGIVMQLEFNPSGALWLRRREARHLLHAALDRTAIARSLHDGVVPATHFGPPCFSDCHDLPLPPAGVTRDPGASNPPGMPLRLLFYDYEPNRHVAEAVAGQWATALGVEVTLTVADFAQGSAENFDILLALRFPTFPSPWAVLEHVVQLTAALDHAAGLRQRNLLTCWLRSPAGTPLPTPALRTLLADAMPVIPLLQIPGHWLQRPGTESFHYPEDGYFLYEEGNGEPA